MIPITLRRNTEIRFEDVYKGGSDATVVQSDLKTLLRLLYLSTDVEFAVESSLTCV